MWIDINRQQLNDWARLLMQLMYVSGSARHKRIRTRNALAVDHAKRFSFLFQDELPLWIFLQAREDLLLGSSRMPPAEFFKLAKSLQVGFGRTPHGIFALY